MPPAIEKLTARFDGLSMRERALVAGAVLAAIVMIWVLAVLDPIAAKERALSAEKSSIEEQIASLQEGVQTANENDPTTLALAREKQLLGELEKVNVQLASQSAGLIPPERMVQVIHDVLGRQRGVALVSLHNRPVESLAPATSQPTAAPAAEAGSSDGAMHDEHGEQSAAHAPTEMTGPFVHPIEIVVEGSYLDVLAYLKALESLDWRFYWKVLDLETQRYPANRVRIELSTLSMDKEWIGV